MFPARKLQARSAIPLQFSAHPCGASKETIAQTLNLHNIAHIEALTYTDTIILYLLQTFLYKFKDASNYTRGSAPAMVFHGDMERRRRLMKKD